jgi:signal transduction histidine kinase
MKYSFLLIVVALWFSPDNSYSREQALPQLTADMVNDIGNIVLGNSEAWKYQPGDNLKWADPTFDDSGWFGIPPGGLGIDAMPDSLWNIYGWWRYTFTADSSFYNENWNLNFSAWGAADVFLDGKRVHQFGNFSTDPDKERTFSRSFAVYPPINITEKETHTLAIRYSHHQAKSYNSIIKVNAADLGFRFGFGTHAINQFRAQSITYQSFTLFISAAVLFVVFLLHFMLFYKFPEDRSNLFISVIVGLLLISAVAIYSNVFSDITSYWFSILTWIWSLSASFVVLFLPYVIAEIFKLEKQKKVLWLIAAFPLIVLTNILNDPLGNYIVLLIYSISIFLVGYICWKAYKSGKRGVGYVASGALGTLSLGVLYMFYVIGYIEISSQIFSVMITFLYTLFPLGMTLYVANGYGYLFTSLESEITDRTKKLKQSLEDLKATQSQLVQQEKLASLGQLTAGIAHEIKNPLNFVNNFSDLILELVEELREEVKRKKGKVKSEKSLRQPTGSGEAERSRRVSDVASDEATNSDLILEILDDIEANLKKIHEHGSRADSIVKSMLEHSRGGSGKPEPTDLNALVKEFTNLTFHGMRASKNPINVDILYELDESVGEIPLVAEDFSRVILNLCNNAFDAMRGKVTEDGGPKTEGEMTEDGGRVTAASYLPKLSVRTKSENGQILIEIEDNGPGIPVVIKDKILQPFFTTKKGTQGTGLGLSITNDIVKAHGGSMEIDSEPGKTVFNIKLKNN